MRPQIRVPRPIGDLFRDLRDRRLLPLVGVLAVAIVAVPFALSKSSSEGGQPGPAIPSAGGAADSTLTIVNSDSGLRDYRHRLSGDQPTNPFLQQYTGVAGGGTGAGDVTGLPTGSTLTGTDTTTDTSTASSGSGYGGSSGGTADDESEGDDSGSEAPSTPPSDGGDEPEPEPAYVVALRVGEPGDTHLRELSEPGPLPSAGNAILTFRGLSEDGHKARFSVSPSVSAIFGDAKCVEGTDRCEIVEIERGLPVNFVYGPSDKVFRVTVVSIERNG